MMERNSAQTKKKMRTKPSVITDEVVRILCVNFTKGYSVEAVCGMSGISRTAFYDFCRGNPDFAELFHLMRKMPVEQAMVNIVSAINAGDVKTSKWLLERVNLSVLRPLLAEDIFDSKIEKVAQRSL